MSNESFLERHAFAVFMSFVVAALLAVTGAAVLISKVANEAGCNQKASQLSSQGVVGGDFRFMSNTCYLTLRDGTVIPADQFRAAVVLPKTSSTSTTKGEH